MSSPSPAPVIFGCAGPTLLPEEKKFFEQNAPLGFILFKRNIVNKAQVQALVRDLNATVVRSSPPILVDQEGGRVARLTPPLWPAQPAVQKEEAESLEEAKQRIDHMYSSIAIDLQELGINTNCAPVLDLDIVGADPIMGDRTFSPDPQVVAMLGEVAIHAMLNEGVTPVMKHIPGHGAASCDSHKALPRIDLPLEELESHFFPFRVNASCPWAMTAHIVYTALDSKRPATLSPLIIQEVIREAIGFKGFLISDDIGMNALTGSLTERTRQALKAGCDAVLHCSGVLAEMEDVMKGI